MNTKRLKLTFLLAFLIGTFNAWSQNNMTIRQSDGNSPTISLSAIGKITFSDNNLVINDKDGNNTAYALASIENITFEATKTGINDEIKLSETFSVYPNPAKDALYLNRKDNASISIYRMDGTVVMSLYPIYDEAIDISSLPQGVYFIKSNQYTAKFYKL